MLYFIYITFVITFNHYICMAFDTKQCLLWGLDISCWAPDTDSNSYICKTLLMRSWQELAELLNMKVRENSVYKYILNREKNKLKGFYSGMK